MLEVVVCCCDDGVIDDAEGVGDPDVLIDIFRLFEVDGWDDRVLVERGFFKFGFTLLDCLLSCCCWELGSASLVKLARFVRDVDVC